MASPSGRERLLHRSQCWQYTYRTAQPARESDEMQISGIEMQKTRLNRAPGRSGTSVKM
jgi:hypothetical protein